jgi:hypothetical protein
MAAMWLKRSAILHSSTTTCSGGRPPIISAPWELMSANNTAPSRTASVVPTVAPARPRRLVFMAPPIRPSRLDAPVEMWGLGCAPSLPCTRPSPSLGGFEQRASNPQPCRAAASSTKNRGNKAVSAAAVIELQRAGELQCTLVPRQSGRHRPTRYDDAAAAFAPAGARGGGTQPSHLAAAARQRRAVPARAAPARGPGEYERHVRGAGQPGGRRCRV